MTSLLRIWIDGDGRPRVLDFERSAVEIGRSVTKNHLSIRSSDVHKQHARIVEKDGALHLVVFMPVIVDGEALRPGQVLARRSLA